MARARKTPADFWKQVDIQREDDCWIYLGKLERNGYGRLRWANGKISSHRLAYILTHGSVPEGLYVLHRCDVKPCCNPKHLYAGTPKQNYQDAKDRKLLPVSCRRGSKNSQSKLDESAVQEMRDLHQGRYGDTKRLAEKYGVTVGTVQRVIHNRGWQVNG